MSGDRIHSFYTYIKKHGIRWSLQNLNIHSMNAKYWVARPVAMYLGAQQ